MFHFVTGGLDAAYSVACEAAGDKGVDIAGGASIVRQALAAGVIDELTLGIAPVLLGSGEHIFYGTESSGFEPVGEFHSSFATGHARPVSPRQVTQRPTGSALDWIRSRVYGPQQSQQDRGTRESLLRVSARRDEAINVTAVVAVPASYGARWVVAGILPTIFRQLSREAGLCNRKHRPGCRVFVGISERQLTAREAPGAFHARGVTGSNPVPPTTQTALQTPMPSPT